MKSLAQRRKASLKQPEIVKEGSCKWGAVRCMRYFSPACYALEVWAPNLMDWEPFARFDIRSEAMTGFDQAVERFGGLLPQITNRKSPIANAGGAK